MSKTPLEIAAIMETLRGVHIQTPVFRRLQDNLHRMFLSGPDGRPTHEPVRFTAGTETHGVIMISGPGAGKTTGIRHAVGALEALAANSDTGLPRHIHVTVASPATLRSLALQFLRALGANCPGERVTVHELWTMVRHRLKLLDISLVVVDEAHDMFRSATGGEAEAMFRMMKSLMQGEHPVVLLLAGTERLLDITKMDAQVNRRFRKVIAPPLDVATGATDIRDTIKFYAGKAGLQPHLPDDVALRLMHGSRYRLGRCIEFILAAIEEALLLGNDSLCVDDFETAFSTIEGCQVAANVFAIDNYLAVDFEDDDEIASRLWAAQEQKRRARANPSSKRGRKAG